MPEWTLCADLKVYARLRAVAKPAARHVTRSGKRTPGADPRHDEWPAYRSPARRARRRARRCCRRTSQ